MMVKNAYYGNVKIMREYCKDCGIHAFIIDGIKQCCDEPLESNIDGRIIMSNPEKRRVGLSRKERKLLLEKQNNRCFYCNRRFGAFYTRGHRRRMLKVQYDHVMPYSGTFNNKFKNFVAACNICNSIKSNKIFEDMDEIRAFILKKLEKKDIYFEDDLVDSTENNDR